MVTPQQRAERRLLTLALLLTLTLLGAGAYFLYEKSQELPPDPVPDGIKTGSVTP